MDRWDEQAILHRATTLADLALHVWPMPNLSDATLATYQKKALRQKPDVDIPRKWNEAAFFQDLAERADPEEVATAREVLAWSQAQTLHIWWGKGTRFGSFFPMLKHKGLTFWLIAVWSNNSVEVQFQHMKPRPTFSSESSRLDLLTRLNTIPGIQIPVNMVGRRPSFPLSALRERTSLQQFLQILEWAIEEIKAG